jgi:hypothetical protein
VLYTRGLDEHVEEMRDAAHALVEHSYPFVSDHEDRVIAPLKQRRIVVDGYDLVLSFNRSDYGSHLIETVEVTGLSPFLPMRLVCKIAIRFLGGHCLLHHVDFVNGHKVYIWKVCIDRRGRPLPLDKKRYESRRYDDLEYVFVR